MIRGPGARRRVLGRSAALLASLWLALPTLASAADPSGSVTPNRDLRNDQRVHVHAEGLPPRTVIVVLECSEGARSAAECEGQSADVAAQTNPSGVYDNAAYLVLTQPNQHFESASIRCDKTHPCVLYVGVDYNDFRQPKVLLPISFGANAGKHKSSNRNYLLAPLVVVVLLGAGVTVRRRRP